MAKDEPGFDKFLASVEPSYQSFIDSLHKYLIDSGCKAKVELKSSGYFVSYSHIKSKRSAVNLLFRKKGLITRVYGENVNKYLEFMDTLPKEMLTAIEKAPACKRMIDPDDCSQKCSMGYSFMINGQRFQKCKYNCFMFYVNEDNNPFIKSFIENEVRERSAL